MTIPSSVLATLHEVVDRLRKDPRVRYADLRATSETITSLHLRETRGVGRDDRAASNRITGVGIRVLGFKSWGFATSASFQPEAITRAAERAITIAASSSSIAHEAVRFPALPAQRGTYVTPVAIDPFAVPLEDKLAALDAPLRLLCDAPEVRSGEAMMEWRRLAKVLVSTEGTEITQTFTYGACFMRVIAAAGAPVRVESRCYPTWDGCHAFQGGYERIAALDLVTAAPTIRDEAIALCTAEDCPAGTSSLILESSQIALQIHESCGHPTELDRALGTEITLAGGSFLAPEMRGSFTYGAPIVTLTADAIAEGGVGTFGWDDEGIPASARPLVEGGVFVDYLRSRETSARLGLGGQEDDPASFGGTMRASSGLRVPLIRMTNVSLAPKSGSLEDLIADTKDGIYMATDRSWSIDDQRLDFQFSCELAWKIENGKRTRLLRRPLYFGRTPQFWGSCDAICGPEEYRLWGVSSCGKGDPMQILGVGHGAAPARFHGVRIGASS